MSPHAPRDRPVMRGVKVTLMVLGLVALLPVAIVTGNVRRFSRSWNNAEYRVFKDFRDWLAHGGKEPSYLTWSGLALLLILGIVVWVR